MTSNFLEILNARGKHLPSSAYSYKTSAEGAGQYALDAVISELKDSEVDVNAMSVMIPYADGRRRDGVGDLLEIGGIDLSRHRLNAVALFDHAKQAQLPLGMCLERDGVRYDRSKYTIELDPVAQVARANIFFYQGKGFQAGNSYDAEPRKVPLSKDEEFEHALFCEQTFDMVYKGMINGGSIGYQVKRANPLQPDYDRGTPQGLHLLETLQLEVSIVVLPANMDTVRKALGDNRCCGKPLCAPLVKSLQCHCPEKKAQLGYEPRLSPKPNRTATDRTVPDPTLPHQTGPHGPQGEFYRDDEEKEIVKSLTPHAAPRKAQMGYERKAVPESQPVPGQGVFGDLKAGDTFWFDAGGFNWIGPVKKVGDTEVHYPDGRKIHLSQWTKVTTQNPKQGKGTPVPLNNDLSNADIPPARWKPGLGAMKELRRKYRKNLTGKLKPGDTAYIAIGMNPRTEVLIDRVDRMGDRDLIHFRTIQNKTGKPKPNAQVQQRWAEDFYKSMDKAHHVSTSYAVRSGGSETNAGEFHDFHAGQWVHTRKPLTYTDPTTRQVTNFAASGERVQITSLNTSTGSVFIRNEAGKEKQDWLTNLRKSLEGMGKGFVVFDDHGRVWDGSKKTWISADSSDADNCVYKERSKAELAAVAAGRTPSRFNQSPKARVQEVALPGTKALPTLRQKYRRPAKSFRRVLRKSSPGSALVYVRGKDLEACRGAAEGRGLKFAHLGRHAMGLEKVKVSGDDKHIDAVAREWGQPVKSVRGAKSMGIKSFKFTVAPKDQPEAMDKLRAAGIRVSAGAHEGSNKIVSWIEADADEQEVRRILGNIPLRRKSLQGANGMKTKGKGYDAMDSQDGAVGLEEPGEAGGSSDLGGQEPYGAQARRRIHQDFSILMQEYDQIMQLCEHEGVKAHLEELLQHFAEHLERIESEWDADEVHKELPPIEGAEKQKDMEEGEEPAEGGEEGEEEPNEPEEEPVESNSGKEGEETDEDEAVEAMKGLYRNVKGLRRARKGLCGACGKGQVPPKQGRVGNPNYSHMGGQVHPQHEKNPSADVNSPASKKPAGEPRGENTASKPHNKPTGGEGNIGKDLTGGITLLPHHHKHVGDAHGFLGEVGSMDGGAWGEEHRMKSYHFHKSLENVADELEFGEDGHEHVPGREEYQDKPGHEGSEDYFEGKVMSPNRPKNPKAPAPDRSGSSSGTLSFKRPDSSKQDASKITTKDLTEDELHQLEGDADRAMEDTEEDKHPHVKALRGASSLCHELSQAHELTEDHQVKAMACHKELNPMLHEVEEDMDIPQGKDGEEADVEVGEMGEMGEKAGADAPKNSKPSYEQWRQANRGEGIKPDWSSTAPSNNRVRKIRTNQTTKPQRAVHPHGDSTPGEDQSQKPKTPTAGNGNIHKDLTDEEVKSLLTLQEQNDDQAQQMKDLSSTIVKLAKLAN